MEKRGPEHALDHTDRPDPGTAEGRLVRRQELDGNRRFGRVVQEASEPSAQRVGHGAGVDLGRRTAEVDGLAQLGSRHISTAEELGAAVGGTVAGSRKLEELWKR